MEQRKILPEWPGYEISSIGEVYSLKTGRPLYKRDRNGYLRVRLHNNGLVKDVPVHRLVAMAFIPNPLGKETVNHKDEDKTNNNVDNLEWMTMAENLNYGTHNYRATLHNYR